MELSLPTPMIRCTFLILNFDHPINYLHIRTYGGGASACGPALPFFVIIQFLGNHSSKCSGSCGSFLKNSSNE